MFSSNDRRKEKGETGAGEKAFNISIGETTFLC